MKKFPVLLSVAILLADCTPAFQEHPDGRISWLGYKGCVEALNRGYVPDYGGEEGVGACLAVQRIEVAKEQARKDWGTGVRRGGLLPMIGGD